MASIRDVAKRANVAACTVSRVLNGTAFVAPDTKDKIVQAMKDLNYIPNELARGMFRQKAGTIAMLVPSIRHPFFSSLANIMERELYEKGYKFMLCSTDDNIEREREYINILKSNIVDGVIMGVCNLEDSEYEQFDKPLLMLDYKVNDKIPIIVSNHEQGGILAASCLISSNCKYIIHLGNSDLAKVESYKSHIALENELDQAGIKSRFVDIKWNEFDFDGYLEVAKAILEEYPEVDGIMASDIQAIAFLKAALQVGKKIPKEFCVVAYDGTYVTNMNLMSVTSIVQSTEVLGVKAIEILLDLVDGKSIESTMNMIDISLFRGETTG